MDEALRVQAGLEYDLEARDVRIAELEGQLRDMRKTRTHVEASLSAVQIEYMAARQDWEDKETEYRKMIRHLQKCLDESVTTPKVDQTVAPSSPVTTSFWPMAATYNAAGTASINTTPIPANPQPNSLERTVTKLKGELEQVHQQLELVSREYALRHDRVKLECQELQAVNQRLMDENDGFQLLLAEKTVLGGFSSEPSSAPTTPPRSLKEHSLSDTSDSDHSQSLATLNLQDEIQHSLNDHDQRRLYELEFECRSLTNHNKALKLSLERLVYRLLEHREFAKVAAEVGEHHARSVSLFNQKQRKLSSQGGSGLAPGDRRPSEVRLDPLYDPTPLATPTAALPSALSPASTSFSSRMYGLGFHRPLAHPPAVWSSMMFRDAASDASSIRADSPVSLDSVSTVASSPRHSSYPRSPSIDSAMNTILDDAEKSRRPSTSSQKKLRRLQLADPN